MPDGLTLHLIRHAPTLPNAQRRYPHPHEDAPSRPLGQNWPAASTCPGARWPSRPRWAARGRPRGWPDSRTPRLPPPWPRRVSA
ncbi:hypothetical protein ACFQDE_10365 [Deinococcus caeni]|uniref:hypothetical protein n=1 Tax=Deinococcus caeni TaxID=569127 RepID=UPI0036128228